MKAVDFIPLLVRLAIELGLVEEVYRGGLLYEIREDGQQLSDNILEDLMRCSATVENRNAKNYGPIDDKYMQVLIKLRKMGFL